MPLRIDYERIFDRPPKRRRLIQVPDMARRSSIEDDNPHCKEGQDETQVEVASRTDAEARTMQPSGPQPEIKTSDRDELMQRIKQGQRPTWVPKPALKALYAEEEALQMKTTSQEAPDSPVSPKNTSFQFEHDLLFGPWTGTGDFSQPPPSITQDLKDNTSIRTVPVSSSILSNTTHITSEPSSYFPDSSPPWHPWYENPTKSQIGQAISGSRDVPAMTPTRPSRSRAPSLSSSFVMRVPTSPLVQSINNPNLDFSLRSGLNNDTATDRRIRRSTMPPNSYQSISPCALEATTPNFSRPLPTPLVRRDSSVPSQLHQPRKSVGSFTFQSSPSPQVHRSPGRRFSLATDMSPMRRTSMVGSFEESILRGRMSSPPSKPFDFVAQIGVMGKGDCPSNLKCPAHVSVPFQAVFYSYPSSPTSRSVADDAPSPYVGTIDIEHGLKSVQLATKSRRSIVPDMDTEKLRLFSVSDPRAPENTSIGKALAREAQMQSSRSGSVSGPRVNLGGAYRVPQQGQLQIIIKNSNTTAVKLFLVSYDLTGMESGTKTFIRQKSYSTGPIVSGALTDKQQQPTILDPLKDKSILRYMIHIKFCCPSKGKFYIYDSIRVVFANRIPDGKEKLRTEIQLQEPKYSPWKPTTSSHGLSRGSVVDFSPESASITHISPPEISEELSIPRSRDVAKTVEDNPTKGRSLLPFHLAKMVQQSSDTRRSTVGSSETFAGFSDLSWTEATPAHPEQPISSVQGFFASTSPRSSPVPGISSGSSTARSFSPAPVEAGAGLLSKQLRGLHGSMSSLRGLDMPADPWSATAKLSRILSQDETGPKGSPLPEEE